MRDKQRRLGRDSAHPSAMVLLGVGLGLLASHPAAAQGPQPIELPNDAAQSPADPPTGPGALTPGEPENDDDFEQAVRRRFDAIRDVAGELQRFCGDPTRGQDLLPDMVDLRAIHSAADDLPSLPAPRRRDPLVTALNTNREAANNALAGQTLCSTYCDAAAPINVCELRRAVPAAAAVVSDWETVSELREGIRVGVRKLVDGYPEIRALADSGDAAARALLTSLAQGNAVFGLNAQFEEDRQEVESALGGLSVVTTRLVRVGMQALARLIQDRARREAIGWFLERMSQDVCDASDDTEVPARTELRTYWFPSLCALSDHGQLLGYGAGAQMLRALRAALEEDIRRWPGSAVGLAVGSLYWQDAQPTGASGLFQCHAESDAETEPCQSLRGVRVGVRRFVDSLIDGEHAATALEDLSNALTDANLRTIRVDDEERRALHSTKTQLLSCVAAFPAAHRDFAGPFATLGLSAEQTAEAASLVALTSSPACWSLTGHGYARDDVAKIITPDGGPAPVLRVAVQTSGETERVTTVLRLHGRLGGAARSLSTAAARLKQAFADYRSRVGDLTEHELEPPELPNLDGVATAESVNEALQAFEGYLRTGSAAQLNGRAQAAVNAAAAVSSAALDLARSSLSVVRRIIEPAVFIGLASLDPSLCQGSRPEAAAPSKVDTLDQCRAWRGDALSPLLRALDAHLESLDGSIRGAIGVMNRQWDQVAARVIGILNQLSVPDDANLSHLQSRVTRYLGVFVAVLTEQDPDALARLLEDAANPVGGWRRKQSEDAFVISITAFPGLWTAAEHRWGPYGAVYERGSDRYLVAPTLALPLGLDFAWGLKGGWSVGGFVSLIDPAAFLQYDVDNDGELPGPQVLSVLAPGLGLRIGVATTPFTVMPMVVYRPSFRTTSAQVAGPGADVLQYGVLLSVDVSLFELYVRPEDSQ